jgi:hypothetical protein
MLIALTSLTVIPLGISGSAESAPTSVQSSISVYLLCSSSISFAEPSSSQTCGPGMYTGAYTGVSQTVGSTQDTVMYLASATGNVKVNYTLVDMTSGRLLIKWLGFGSVGGGSCTTPTAILPTNQTFGSPSYLIETGVVINSGDMLKLFLDTAFTPAPGTTGSPSFCSGGGGATLVSIGTTVVTGSLPPSLTTELNPGTPSGTTLGGVPGLAETYVNTGGASLTVLVLGVVKNSGGSTVDVIATSFPVDPGKSATAFLAFGQYPSGTYTITVIAVTASSVAISTPVVATVSV